MNQTPQGPPTEETRTAPPPSDRLRSVVDAKRSRSDALLGGVSTGVAKHFDIDPVIVRIGFVVMTLIGGSGLIIYLAAWFLLPAEDGPSAAAEWFNLDDNEERVRVGGLVAAAVIGLLAVVGDTGWGWGAGFPWWVLPVAVLFLIFVALPRRRREAAESSTEASIPVEIATSTAPPPRRRGSQALFGLTASFSAIALAITRIVGESNANGNVEWTTYVAVTLGVVGLGLLVSTIYGDGLPLIGIGIVLAVVLAVGSAIPTLRVGEQTQTPETAAAVESSYDHGVGKLVVDLSDVTDPEVLLGRTIHIDSGIGETRVILPDSLDVAVDATLRAGEIRVFDRKANGTNAHVVVPAQHSPQLTVEIHHRLGTIEVIRE